MTTDSGLCEALIEKVTTAVSAAAVVAVQVDSTVSGLYKSRGVKIFQRFNLQRDGARARSVFCGQSSAPCGTLSSQADRDYFKARFGHWQPVASANDFSIPSQKYRLLDEVAAWWPLDGEELNGFWANGQWRSPGRVREVSLRGVHGRLSNSTAASVVLGCLRGNCLELSGSGEILVDDRPQLRRNDEEMSLSLWVKPALNRGVLFERQLTGASSVRVYSLTLLADGRLSFSYLPATGRGGELTSVGRLTTGDWHHVAVSWEIGGAARLFIDGRLDATASTTSDRLPMAEWSSGYQAYPAISRVGSQGYRGLIDDVILFYGAQDPQDLQSLYQSYGSGGLTWQVATCPLNRTSCLDSELFATLSSSVSPTFAILVKHTRGTSLTGVTATVTDSGGNELKIAPTDIVSPGSHGVIDGSYWLVRVKGADHIANGALRVEPGPGSHTWTVRVEGVWNGGKNRIERRFLIAN